IRFTAAASVLLLLALVGGIVYGMRTPPIAPPQQVAAGEKIKLGFIVSYYSATATNRMAIPPGFVSLIGTALRDFNSPEFDRWAIIEPGSADKGDVPRMLRNNFPAGHVIDGSDPIALEKLDVIVSCLNPNMRDEVMEAIKQVVG